MRVRPRFAAILTAPVLVFVAAAARAQESRSAVALIHVSAEVLPSCRIADVRAGLLYPVELDCSRGLSVSPRVHIVESARGPVRVINF
jgi:hypothetical protein